MIEQFKDDYSFLSNFTWLETPIKENGIEYYTSEAYYMSQKTSLIEEKALLGGRITGAQAKKIGRAVTLVPNFDSIKDDCMRKAIQYKFSDDNPNLKAKLIDTGDKELVEGNYWHDLYWGRCLKTGNGLNMLGKIIMEVRDDLIKNN